MNQQIYSVLSAALLSGILLFAGCDHSEIDSLVFGEGDNPSGTPVAFGICLHDTPVYNSPQTGAPATRSGDPLLSEWVKVNSFDVTRSIQAPEDPQLAALELFEDTVSTSPMTRANMSYNTVFRLIVFRKIGENNYLFQSVADYVSSGNSSAPKLKQGSIKVLLGQTVRIVGYSFNNTTLLGELPSSYTWGSSEVNIANLNNDFLTYDSNDLTPAGTDQRLIVRFSHLLCKLTVQIGVMGFDSNTFTNCTGVYVKEGGNSSSWKVGTTTVNANTNNTATFSIPDNSTASVCLVPFASGRPITVYFGTLTVAGIVTNQTEITSSQSVQLIAGRSYTMRVQFKNKWNTQIPEWDFDIGNKCTKSDKSILSRLIWSPGNLRQAGDDGSGVTIFAGPSDNGHYYTWFSNYTGNTTSTKSDPCATLNTSTYGTGWRTPTRDEIERLIRCSADNAVEFNGRKVMWFMNQTRGLYLVLAGARSYNGGGAGTVPDEALGKCGRYWSSESLSTLNDGSFINIPEVGPPNKVYTKPTAGNSVRCVKSSVK